MKRTLSGLNQAGPFCLPLALVLAGLCYGRHLSLADSVSSGVGPAPRPIEEKFGSLPLRFESNRGQAYPQAKFLCRTGGYTLFLTSTGAVMSLPRSLLSIRLAETEGNSLIEGAGPLPGTTNYFLGNNPKQWYTNIPSYASVIYRGVYPGVDLAYHGNEGRVEYDFVVAAGADAGRIGVTFEGARKIEVDARGDLVLDTPSGSVIQRKPRMWQRRGEEKREISGSYVLQRPNRVAFAIGPYDPKLPLVIDPELVYATYLGGADLDQIEALAVSGQGDVYVAGVTRGSFPVTPGAPQTSAKGGTDVFVARLNSAGSALVYATYLGSSAQDFASGIAIDAEGNAYITGVTGYDHTSPDFPTTPGALQTKSGGNADAFVTKLNPAGTALVYSTYLGGDGFERPAGEMGGGIAVDSAGNAYVTGSAPCSSSFPVTPGVFRGSPGWCYGFLAKLNPLGTELAFSTDVGGQHIALDPAGNVYLAGFIGDRFSHSADFPTTPGAWRSTCRRGDYGSTGDAFIAKIDGTGRDLIYSTCFAGYITGMTVDATGNVFVTGGTNSADFTTTAGSLRSTGNKDCNADLDQGFVSAHADCEVFVTKLNPTGTALVYSTYLAGSDPNTVNPHIAVDSAGNAYIAGATYGYERFPVSPDSFPATPLWSAFLAKLNAGGSALIDSTRLPSSTAALQLAVDPDGNAYVSGWTYSQDRVSATPGALQISYGGGSGDGFISKVRLRDSPAVPSFDSSGMLNAASLSQGPIAPGELITVLGSQFGPARLTTLELTLDRRVDSSLAGTRLLFDGVPAAMIYTAENQMSAVVPYGLAGRTSVQVQLEFLGNRSAPVTLPVALSAPGIFTLNSSGTGQGAIVNADPGTPGDLKVNSPANPARIGSVISVYATGGGQTSPPGVDGDVPATVFPRPTLPVEATIGGVKAEVLSATAAPGLVSGVLQVNIRIPAGVSPGNSVAVALVIGGVSSQPGVTMAVR